MEILKSKTPRGFALINFTDFYGEECSIQKAVCMEKMLYGLVSTTQTPKSWLLKRVH